MREHDEAILVTDAGLLLGTWMTQTLDGQDVRALRAHSGRPLAVTFVRLEGELRWHANDVANAHSGTFSVSAQGRFDAIKQMITAVGTIDSRPLFRRNPQAVEQATEARLLPAADGKPPTLRLLGVGTVIAVYTGHAPE